MRSLKYSIFFPLAILSATAAYPFPDSSSKADEQAGAALYRDKGCPQCHGADLNGNKKGPSLAAIRTDPAWPPEKITKQIMDGGPKMPPFGESLTDPEVAQLVAFLRAKDRPAPPAAANPPSN
ncbi:MAG TPA: cytochrome c [Terracidiphilus sp.]|jgi:mono/diheme cytochrome c family protein